MGYAETSMLMLKFYQNEIIEPLLYIINSSLQEGIFPEKCKLAKLNQF